jgi:hypothetical protein
MQLWIGIKHLEGLKKCAERGERLCRKTSNNLGEANITPKRKQRE